MADPQVGPYRGGPNGTTLSGMTRRLVLVRHAQAQGSHPDGDHERELTTQGRADAVRLGRWLQEEGLAPDHVLVSTATRAGQTLEALQRGLAGPPIGMERLWREPRLYEGGVKGLLASVREAPEEARLLWVVGHQPTVGLVTAALADPRASRPGALEALDDGFPTASCAVLTTTEPWVRLQAGTAALVVLHTARA